MTELIQEQFYQFCTMFYLGTALFFLYGLLRRYLEKYDVSLKIAFCQELAFFVFAGLLTGWILELTAFGEIGWHTAAGFLLGYPVSRAVL